MNVRRQVNQTDRALFTPKKILAEDARKYTLAMRKPVGGGHEPLRVDQGCAKNPCSSIHRVLDHVQSCTRACMILWVLAKDVTGEDVVDGKVSDRTCARAPELSG